MESLEGLESRGGTMRLSANAGSLRIVFPRKVREDLLANAPTSTEPTPEDLEALDQLKQQLDGYAGEESFLRVLCVRGRSCSTSRFEMPPELWRVLSGRLGWRDVHTITTGR